MSNFFKSISEKEFKNKVSIKVNNILEGFDRYNSGLLEYKDEENFSEKEKAFINFFNDALRINDGEAIIDLYIKELSDENKEILLNSLDKKDRELLKSSLEENELKSVYFEVESKEIISLITRLNTRELFFCTVYFINKPITIWGNYGLSFPMLFNEKAIFDIYENLAKKNNLEVRGVIFK